MSDLCRTRLSTRISRTQDVDMIKIRLKCKFQQTVFKITNHKISISQDIVTFSLIYDILFQQLPDIEAIGDYILVLTGKVNVSVSDIRWYHNGQMIKSCKHYHTSYRQLNGQVFVQLRIATFNGEDVGIYTCDVRNNGGQAVSSCYASMKG